MEDDVRNLFGSIYQMIAEDGGAPDYVVIDKSVVPAIVQWIDFSHGLPPLDSLFPAAYLKELLSAAPKWTVKDIAVMGVMVHGLRECRDKELDYPLSQAFAVDFACLIVWPIAASNYYEWIGIQEQR